MSYSRSSFTLYPRAYEDCDEFREELATRRRMAEHAVSSALRNASSFPVKATLTLSEDQPEIGTMRIDVFRYKAGL